MLNFVWITLILLSVAIGGYTGKLESLGDQAIAGAKMAVEIALGLLGGMALWLGVMRLAEKAGVIAILARLLRPVMKRLFPEVPSDHPAMGAMIMNMAANILGIGNAATPFGLRAMRELQKLNKTPGTATNAMCMFLAINTSSIQAIPANTVALMAALGSTHPSAIIGTSFLATICSTVVGVLSARLMEKLPGRKVEKTSEANEGAPREMLIPEVEETVSLPPQPLGLGGKLIMAGFAAGLALLLLQLTFPKNILSEGSVRLVPNPGATNLTAILTGAVVSETSTQIVVRVAPGQEISVAKAAVKEVVRPQTTVVRLVNGLSALAIPGMLAGFILLAALKGIKVYESFVEGAKEGFNVVVSIIPHGVAMLTAIYLFRASGGIDFLTALLRPVTQLVGVPSEVLPLALIRPLSNSGANAVLMDICRTFGADHLLARMGGTIMGSTETTFYVIAVYFGTVGIRRTRHAMAAGLLADAAGVIASVIICRMMF